MTRPERAGPAIAGSVYGNFGYFDVNNLALNTEMTAELYFKFVRLYVVTIVQLQFQAKDT